MPALHVVITTHTTRHLRRVLLGVFRQERRADRVVVSTDNDLEEIASLIGACAGEFEEPITLVQRPFRGASRSGQVRNNGVRALLAAGAADEDLVVFLDGDCCPASGAFAAHERLSQRGDLVVGFRVDLTPEQTEAFDDSAVSRAAPPAEIMPEQLRSLRARARRYGRHALLRRFGLVKSHKPKVLSANFSIRLATYRGINGFDEEYIGYGGEDDDLGRRVYRAGGRPVIGLTEAVVYHLWHPTRAASEWEASPGIARFQQRTPDRAAFGLDRPYDQPQPRVTLFEATGVRTASNQATPAPTIPVRTS